jgi:D-alanyl-lipoteichoic acid acyltransferase DltB (MBOAT superfamily)
LTGNQFWVPPWRSYGAIFIVFLLCGFWHGASWTFVTWGVLHGTMQIAERAFLLKGLQRLPKPVQNLYAMLLVMAGWILFRADSFAGAASYFRALSGLKDWTAFHWSALEDVINGEAWWRRRGCGGSCFRAFSFASLREPGWHRRRAYSR